jgi:SulP family sulfate permease
VEPSDPERHDAHADTRVVYVSGPLFFGSVTRFQDAVEDIAPAAHLVLSLRGMPMVDHMGVETIHELIERQRRGGGDVHLTGLHPSVRTELTRAGVLDHLGRERVHWSAEQAIHRIHQERARHDAVEAAVGMTRETAGPAEATLSR